MSSILDVSSLYNSYNITSSKSSSLQSDLKNVNDKSSDDELMNACKGFESYFVQKIIEQAHRLRSRIRLVIDISGNKHCPAAFSFSDPSDLLKHHPLVIYKIHIIKSPSNVKIRNMQKFHIFLLNLKILRKRSAGFLCFIIPIPAVM